MGEDEVVELIDRIVDEAEENIIEVARAAGLSEEEVHDRVISELKARKSAKGGAV